MFGLPEKFVVFDLEWTAWEGSRERGWSVPDEHREVYDIGAVLVVQPVVREQQGRETFEIKNTFRQLVTLEIVPRLPEYSEKLTGITQADIDQGGVSFKQALAEFDTFTEGSDMYNWGTGDGEAIVESCRLKNLANPFEGRIHDIREVFKARGIPVENYMSSTIVEYFGERNKHTAHQGLNDALNIVEALQLLRSR